jgi:hypothetical protein
MQLDQLELPIFKKEQIDYATIIGFIFWIALSLELA